MRAACVRAACVRARQCAESQAPSEGAAERASIGQHTFPGGIFEVDRAREGVGGGGHGDDARLLVWTRRELRLQQARQQEVRAVAYLETLLEAVGRDSSLKRPHARVQQEAAQGSFQRVGGLADGRGTSRHTRVARLIKRDTCSLCAEHSLLHGLRCVLCLGSCARAANNRITSLGECYRARKSDAVVASRDRNRCTRSKCEVITRQRRERVTSGGSLPSAAQ